MRLPNVIVGAFRPIKRPKFDVNTELEKRQRSARIPALRRALEAAVRDGDTAKAKALTNEVHIAMREFAE